MAQPQPSHAVRARVRHIILTELGLGLFASVTSAIIFGVSIAGLVLLWVVVFATLTFRILRARHPSKTDDFVAGIPRNEDDGMYGRRA